MLSRHRRSPKNLTLNDIYPEWLNDMGVVSSITDAPWYSSVDLSSLDIAYHGVRSGLKFASPVLYNFIDDTGRITMFTYGVVGRMLWSRYRLKWTHLWSLYQSEYNPLHSYNISERAVKETEFDSAVTDNRKVEDSASTTYPTKTVQTDTASLTSGEEETTFPTKSTTTSSTKTFPSKSTTTSSTRTPSITERTVIDDDSTNNVMGSDNLTHGKSTTTSGTSTNTAQENTFGFNTVEVNGVPQNRSTENGTTSSTETDSGTDSRATAEQTTASRDATNTVTTTGTETTSGSESESYTGNETTSGSESESYTGNKTVASSGSESVDDTVVEKYSGPELTDKEVTDKLTRDVHDIGTYETTTTKTGNIFKSPAELLTVDREFWLTEFFDIIFDDIDAMLTLAVYSESPVYHKNF